MIFLTVGSHEPFDRLVEAADKWAAGQPAGLVLAQITAKGKYRPQHLKTIDYMSEQAYRQACAEADLLIAHAGMGSIITALTFQKPIVIMPRTAKFGETRNDHQIGTAERFRKRPGIYVAADESGLAAAISEALSNGQVHPTLCPFADPQLIDFLRSAIGK